MIFGSFSSEANKGIGTDSRIRTFVYGPNDVFRVTTTYGYQTTIEFEDDEKIRTISLGNSGYFRVTPLRNKIILRALQSNLLTNVTVITDKRTYQFEFSSITNSINDIMYVVRFYYPENGGDAPPPMLNTPTMPAQNMMQLPTPNMPLNNVSVPEVKLGASPVATQPMMMNIPPATQPMQQGNLGLNYNYTLTGPESLSPSEVFDDGSKTYIKFNNQSTPLFKFAPQKNQEIPANYQLSNGYYVVEGVAPQINIYFGSEKISLYNEAYGR
ncbi:MAG: TrbG/VirB9 family P-type conjugative transfer protein [Rickettsiales bacterium]|nr:TrbG/VirB9 family P-type conjugative transfer protein [Rickettsiales bacterium]